MGVVKREFRALVGGVVLGGRRGSSRKQSQHAGTINAKTRAEERATVKKCHVNICRSTEQISVDAIVEM